MYATLQGAEKGARLTQSAKENEERPWDRKLCGSLYSIPGIDWSDDYRSERVSPTINASLTGTL